MDRTEATITKPEDEEHWTNRKKEKPKERQKLKWVED